MTDWLTDTFTWESIFRWLKTLPFTAILFWILKTIYRVIHRRIFPYSKIVKWLDEKPTGPIDKLRYKQYLKNASEKDKAFNKRQAAIRVLQRAGRYEAYAERAITVDEINQIDQERTGLHRDESGMALLPEIEPFEIELGFLEQTGGTLDSYASAMTSFQETSSQTDPQPSTSC